MAGNLRERWIARHADARQRGLRLAPYSDDQNAIRPQMQCRTNGRNLTHTAVTEKFAPQRNGRENKGQSTGCKQVLEIDDLRYANPACTLPTSHSGNALEEV